jgi:DNA-binding cell septation regulator SpoVG
VSINKLTAETQKLSESPDNLKMVWWVPVEFWEAVFAQDQNIPNEKVEEILSVFNRYTMLSTIDGTISAFGEVTYKTKEQIFRSLEIIDGNNKVFYPLPKAKIDSKTNEVISFIRPVLANMLGEMGKNMYFFIFQNNEDPTKRIIDPIKKDKFTVKLDGEALQWELPLSSLLKPKKCPIDNKLMNGTWTYCPYHGTALIPSGIN